MPIGEKADWEFDDPVMQQKSALTKFRHDVNMLHSMVESFHTELAKLTPINEQLCTYVRRIASAAPPTANQETVTRILANSDSQVGVSVAFEQTKAEHRALLDQLERLRAEMSHLETRIKERQIALGRKDHYVAKVAKLKAKNPETEKCHRNTQKLAHAETAFEDIDKFVIAKLNEFMENRLETIDSIVQKHRQSIKKYFTIASTEPILGDINKEGKPLSGPLTPAIPLSPASMTSPTSPSMALDIPPPTPAAKVDAPPQDLTPIDKGLTTPVAVTVQVTVEDATTKTPNSNNKKASPKKSKSKLGTSPPVAQVEAPVEVASVPSPKVDTAPEQSEIPPMTPEGITGSAVE